MSRSEGEMTLFDAGLSARARDNALARVARNVDTEWRNAAERAVHTVAGREAEFTTDQVWVLLQAWGAPPPTEPRGMGAIMKYAQRKGWIEPTDRFEPTKRVQGHAGPTRVWRSLLWSTR